MWVCFVKAQESIPCRKSPDDCIMATLEIAVIIIIPKLSFRRLTPLVIILIS